MTIARTLRINTRVARKIARAQGIYFLRNLPLKISTLTVFIMKKMSCALFFLLFGLTASAKDLSFSTSCNDPGSSVTISFVGDILIHEALYRSVVSGTQHFTQLWRSTNPLIQKADFSVGNLEGPAALGVDKTGRDRGDVGFVYDGVIYSGTQFIFNYHPRILQDLLNSGYDLLTVANNHVLDRRSLGIDKTIRAAESVGVPTVGTRHSLERNADFYKIVKIQDMNIAFVGCTEMTNGIPDTKDQVLFCYRDSERILGIIKEVSARPDVDALVVLPHWGVEYAHTPDSQQKSFARKLLEAGALAVVGSHPHVLQPWDKYITRDGRETWIVYSLGNFVAGQAGLARQTGAVAYLGLKKKNGSEKSKIFAVGYTPTYRKDLELIPIGSQSDPDILNHVRSFYGTQGRVEPGAPLISSLCRKK